MTVLVDLESTGAKFGGWVVSDVILRFKPKRMPWGWSNVFFALYRVPGMFMNKMCTHGTMSEASLAINIASILVLLSVSANNMPGTFSYRMRKRMLGGVGRQNEITRSLHVTHNCVRTESLPETNPY